jgi:hypothetical protein
MQRLKRRMKGPVLTAMLLGGIAFSSSAKAATINPSLNQFILTNTSADGSVDISNNGLSFVLIGGNTGSGVFGTTDFTSLAQNTGTVEFHYSYASFDTPGFDFAGYLLGNTRVQLAGIDGEAGLGSFSVSSGQSYGWYVNTLDNTGEPGSLTVTFTPVASTPAPEPAGFAFALIGSAALVVKWRLSVSALRSSEEKL